jgi:hypothetical protein
VSNAAVLEQYIDRCHEQIFENEKALRFIARAGVTERFVLESFRIGFAEGNLAEVVQGNTDLYARCESLGLLSKSEETLRNRIVIPLVDENRATMGLVGVALLPKAKRRIIIVGEPAVFNAPFLRNILPKSLFDPAARELR